MRFLELSKYKQINHMPFCTIFEVHVGWSSPEYQTMVVEYEDSVCVLQPYAGYAGLHDRQMFLVLL